MREIFTVTELNGEIKHLLEKNFDTFWVQGEVSNLHRPASGHTYFTLKDENSQIRAVIFRSAFGRGPFFRPGAVFELENGMSIVCCARLSVYQPRGEYQLLVENVEPTGIGALQKAFEQLKARLQAEGLFDPALKKALPFIPKRIAVITSPTGAVIRDILNITRRRFPSVNVLVAPVSVQGPGAAGEIIQALRTLPSLQDVEVIILARGGGSLEDLAPFNDEGVARAIFQCPVPIISAVGHETDFTIADFVADLRAPTPSAAAELAVPVRADLVATLTGLRLRLMNQERRQLTRVRETLFNISERLPSPRSLISDQRLALDARLERIQAILDKQTTSFRQQLHSSALRLRHVNPAVRIREGRQNLLNVERSIVTNGRHYFESLKKRLEAGMMMLDTLSPFSVLRRGYSITRTVPEGRIVKDAAVLTLGSGVDVTLAVGGFRAKVTEIPGVEDDGQRTI